ncbi:GNAT family N-acetyltransferase [Cellulomonas sp. SLBN-39]|uniref:GNAT family N-acetyltransferase n=1 Tax=Cellulomonas sp. SLBN-39 TaxID=2768446 RepID=UPI00351B3163
MSRLTAATGRKWSHGRMTDVEVRDVPERHRYEAWVGDERAGVAVYVAREDGARVLTHTVVEDAWEGRGVGSALARRAFDDARSGGYRVVPQCPFMAAWVGSHPDHADVVADATP